MTPFFSVYQIKGASQALTNNRQLPPLLLDEETTLARFWGNFCSSKQIEHNSFVLLHQPTEKDEVMDTIPLDFV